jgi:hypothetical protein
MRYPAELPSLQTPRSAFVLAASMYDKKAMPEHRTITQLEPAALALNASRLAFCLCLTDEDGVAPVPKAPSLIYMVES